jgi:SAM-dependent methyltransferase
MIYENIKRLIKCLIPERLIIRNEVFIRAIYYQFYRGNKFQCNVCSKKLRKFVTLHHSDLICPACGSLARNRRLWSILTSGYLKEGIQVLDFSPSRSIYRKLKKYNGIDYIPSDFAGEFLSDKYYNITNVGVPDNSFDLVICYHVLEHIEDDRKAMKELFRILKKGGSCIIQTPYKKGDIYEDSSITSPVERIKHFGQSDHVRIYSVEGLAERLTLVGFTTEIKEFHEETANRFGFQQNEKIIIAKK